MRERKYSNLDIQNENKTGQYKKARPAAPVQNVLGRHFQNYKDEKYLVRVSLEETQKVFSVPLDLLSLDCFASEHIVTFSYLPCLKFVLSLKTLDMEDDRTEVYFGEKKMEVSYISTKIGALVMPESLTQVIELLLCSGKACILLSEIMKGIKQTLMSGQGRHNITQMLSKIWRGIMQLVRYHMAGSSKMQTEDNISQKRWDSQGQNSCDPSFSNINIVRYSGASGQFMHALDDIKSTDSGDRRLSDLEANYTDINFFNDFRGDRVPKMIGALVWEKDERKRKTSLSRQSTADRKDKGTAKSRSKASQEVYCSSGFKTPTPFLDSTEAVSVQEYVKYLSRDDSDISKDSTISMNGVHIDKNSERTDGQEWKGQIGDPELASALQSLTNIDDIVHLPRKATAQEDSTDRPAMKGNLPDFRLQIPFDKPKRMHTEDAPLPSSTARQADDAQWDQVQIQQKQDFDMLSPGDCATDLKLTLRIVVGCDRSNGHRDFLDTQREHVDVAAESLEEDELEHSEHTFSDKDSVHSTQSGNSCVHGVADFRFSAVLDHSDGCSKLQDTSSENSSDFTEHDCMSELEKECQVSGILAQQQTGSEASDADDKYSVGCHDNGTDGDLVVDGAHGEIQAHVDTTDGMEASDVDPPHLEMSDEELTSVKYVTPTQTSSPGNSEYFIDSDFITMTNQGRILSQTGQRDTLSTQDLPTATGMATEDKSLTWREDNCMVDPHGPSNADHSVRRIHEATVGSGVSHSSASDGRKESVTEPNLSVTRTQPVRQPQDALHLSHSPVIPPQNYDGSKPSVSQPEADSHPCPSHVQLPPVVFHRASSVPPWATKTPRLDLRQGNNPAMANLLTRRGTYYRGWPTASGQDPAMLSLAGFYYTEHERRVRCWWCGLELPNLSPGQDPWVEHVRHSPDCRYLLEMRGRDYIARAQAQPGTPPRTKR